jgi:hypothetical protein
LVDGAAAIRPPYWFGGRAWYGTQAFSALFGRETTNLPIRATYACSPTELTTQNVSLVFNSHPEMMMNASMAANQSFVNDTINAQAFQGSLAFDLLNRIDDPIGLDFEETIYFALTENLELGRLPLRAASTMFGKVGYLTHPGNYGLMRFVQRFQISTQGQITSYMNLKPAVEASCLEPTSDTTGVVESASWLVENRWTWAAHPWSACSATDTVPQQVLSSIPQQTAVPLPCLGNRTRRVSCIDLYGNPASETVCSAAEERAPPTAEQCMASECAAALAIPGLDLAPWASQGVRVPVELQGRWTAVFHTLRTGLAGDAGLAMPSSKLVRVVSIEIHQQGDLNHSEAGSAGAYPNITITDRDQVFAYQEDLRNATLVRASADDSLSFAGRINAAGNATHGVISANGAATAAAERSAAFAELSLVYAPSSNTDLIGHLSGSASGPGSLALAVTPGAPELAATMPIERHLSRANSTSQQVLDLLGVPSLRTSVHTGLAVKGTPALVQRPLETCSYDPARNTCVRRRPPMACISDAGDVVDDVFCAGQAPPALAGPTELACTGCVRYDIGEWSQCSQPCQSGAQTRRVQCLDASNASVPMAHCAAYVGPAPPSGQTCNNFACATYQTGEWSSCSSTCGPGQETRPVQCVDIAGPLDESRCVSENRPRPNATRSCFRCPCEDASLTLTPTVMQPSASDLSSLSTPRSFRTATADSFCPGQSRLLRISEWGCYPQADQDRMCATFNAVSGAAILPFAFRAEQGVSVTPASFVPEPQADSPAPDTYMVRPDVSCFFLPFQNPDTGFVDPSRQGAVGMCRQQRSS